MISSQRKMFVTNTLEVNGLKTVTRHESLWERFVAAIRKATGFF